MLPRRPGDSPHLTERSIDATVAALEQIVAQRGRAQRHLSGEHRPELTAHALREWCRSARTGINYIEPGASGENAYVENPP